MNPNNIDKRDGYRLPDYATAGSGIGNVYVNSKYLFKLSGLYQLPLQFNVSAFYNARQGYPFEAAVQVLTNLPNGGGQPTILLDNVGERTACELPESRPAPQASDRLRRIGEVSAVDRHLQPDEQRHDPGAARQPGKSNNANNIQAIVAPRVIRFGLRVKLDNSPWRRRAEPVTSDGSARYARRARKGPAFCLKGFLEVLEVLGVLGGYGGNGITHGLPSPARRPERTRTASSPFLRASV